MTHDEARTALLDGVRPDDHLSGCDECSRFATNLHIVDAVAPALAPSAPESLAGRITAALATDVSAETSVQIAAVTEQDPPVRVRRPAPLAIGAVVVAASLVAAILVSRPQTEDSLTMQGAPAVERMRVYAVEEQGEPPSDGPFAAFTRGTAPGAPYEAIERTLSIRTEDGGQTRHFLVSSPGRTTGFQERRGKELLTTRGPEACGLDKPVTIARFPLEPVSFPDVEARSRCGERPSVKVSVRVAGREELVTAGRTWQVWKIVRDWRSEAGSQTVTSWFDQQLGRDVKTITSWEGGATQTRLLTELRQPLITPPETAATGALGPSWVYAQGEADFQGWETYFYNAFGGVCYGRRELGRSEGGYSCGSDVPEDGQISADFRPIHDDHPEPSILVYGVVGPSVASIRIDLSDKSVVHSLPVFVSTAARAVGFFATVLPSPGREAVALDEDGVELDRAPNLIARMQPPPSLSSHPSADIASGTEGGIDWALRASRTGESDLCWTVELTPGTASNSCGPYMDGLKKSLMFGGHDVGGSSGLKSYTGTGPPNAARVRFELEDGGTREFGFVGDDPWFGARFYVVILPSSVAVKAIANLDADGNVIARRELPATGP